MTATIKVILLASWPHSASSASTPTPTSTARAPSRAWSSSVRASCPKGTPRRCWGDAPDPTKHTTYNARTFLQPQLQKAARSTEKASKGDNATRTPLSHGHVRRKIDKMIWFHALHDLRRYTVPRCWPPHTQTQMYGIRR